MNRRTTHEKLVAAAKSHGRPGRDRSAAKISDSIATTVRGLRDGALGEMVAKISDDRLFRRELEELRELERVHRQPGVDLRRFLKQPIQHPFLRKWMDLSDAAVDERPGRADLRRRRRHGVPRLLDGEERGMPFDLPPLAFVPMTLGTEMRVFELFDEAEYHILAFRPCSHPAVPMRPVKEVLFHRDIRALLGVRASTLDSWLHLMPEMVGGLRKLRLGERRPEKTKPTYRPRETTHRVAADCLSFMVWLNSNQN